MEFWNKSFDSPPNFRESPIQDPLEGFQILWKVSKNLCNFGPLKVSRLFGKFLDTPGGAEGHLVCDYILSNGHRAHPCELLELCWHPKCDYFPSSNFPQELERSAQYGAFFLENFKGTLESFHTLWNISGPFGMFSDALESLGGFCLCSVHLDNKRYENSKI